MDTVVWCKLFHPDDIQALKPHDWVHVECRRREKPAPEGIYVAGGCIVGQFQVPDVYYITYHKTRVLILLDPVLNDLPFIVLIEDIKFLEVLPPSVPDDD